jgi:hypothetical protein
MYAKTCKTDVSVFIYNIIQLMTFHFGGHCDLSTQSK